MIPNSYMTCCNMYMYILCFITFWLRLELSYSNIEIWLCSNTPIKVRQLTFCSWLHRSCITCGLMSVNLCTNFLDALLLLKNIYQYAYVIFTTLLIKIQLLTKNKILHSTGCWTKSISVKFGYMLVSLEVYSIKENNGSM